MKKKIGFIGLGTMGMPMAKNLLSAGYTVLAYDLNKIAVDEIASFGAEPCDSIKNLSINSDIIITIVPADKQVLDIYQGENGIIMNAKNGTICIEMTSAMGQTIKMLATAAKAAGKEIYFIDAPVSGGETAAKAGTLTIMAGGEQQIIEKIRPILEVLGKNILYAGGIGDGKNAKMINQFLNAANTYIASEALYLAKCLKMDMNLLLDILKKSSGNSWVLQNNVPKYALPKLYDGGFRLELMKKDLDLAMEQAAKLNITLPVGEQVQKVYQAEMEKAKGKCNYNIIFEWIESYNKQ